MLSIVDKARQVNIPVSETEPLKMSFALHPKRTVARYDMHFGFELGIVLCGAMRRYYPKYSQLVRQGQVWFCDMWEPHGYTVVKAPCRVLVFIIWPPLLAQLQFNEAPEFRWMAPFTVKPADHPQLIASAARNILLDKIRVFKKLTKETASALQKVRARICLFDILTLFLDDNGDARCDEARVARDRFSSLTEDWNKLNRALQLAFESRSFISTKRAARECGLNRNVFSRLFKKWMGIRFSDFTLRHRINQSVRQLLDGNDPIKTICNQWGFVNLSHFNRLFRKYYGSSPSEFRQQHKAKTVRTQS
jgi:AraC-like DNA-binding protein